MSTKIPTSVLASRIIGLALLIILCLPAIGVEAQTPTPQPGQSPIRMQVEAAYDGNYKYGEWLPVWVELENNGSDLKGEVRARIVGGGGAMVFAVPVELPAVSRKRLPVYVLANNFSRQVDVSLIADGQTLASAKADVNPQVNLAYFAGLVAPERGILSLIEAAVLPGTPRHKVLVDLPLQDIPERYEGLRSFDLLVLNGVDTSTLSPEQVAALETWVRKGGRLVVGGGAGAARTIDALPKTLLPFTLEGIEEIQSLSGLQDFIAMDRPVRIPGPFPVAVGQADNARTLADQDGLPLISEWRLGSGYVDFIALDLNASPFDAWNGTIPFWEKLLSPGSVFPDWMPIDVSARQQLAGNMPYTLQNLPILDLPSARGLALLLGLYILLVGPVNYLLLRWQKRLHLAWVTIPLITLIFSAAAFGLGYALHGTDVFLNKIAIIQVEPGGKARVDSFVGLFSPAQSAYEIEVRGAGLLSPLSPYYDPWNSFSGTPGISNREMVLVQGSANQPGYVRGLNVEQWSMQGFMAESLSMDFGEVSSTVRLEDTSLVGEVNNQSSHTLKDAAVIFGKKFVHLGDLAPISSTEFKLDLSDMGSSIFSQTISWALFEGQLNNPTPDISSRQAEVRRSIVESVFERTPTPVKIASSSAPSGVPGLNNIPVFIAWLDQAPPEVSVSGATPAQQTTAMVVMPLGYSLPEEGPIALPPGFIPGILAKNPQEGGICGEPGSTAVYLFRGEAVFEFTLPADLANAHVDHLKLSLASDTGTFNASEVALYNWKLDQWVVLDGYQQGVNLIPSAADLVREDGLVQVRLTAPQTNQGCYYVALGLEGQRP